MQFTRDIAAADKLTFDIQLGYGWPVGKFFDAFTDIPIVEDVDIVELCTVLIENMNDLR